MCFEALSLFTQTNFTSKSCGARRLQNDRAAPLGSILTSLAAIFYECFQIQHLSRVTFNPSRLHNRLINSTKTMFTE